MSVLATLGKLGRTLQLPIAVLPVAALLLRFGKPDLLDLAFMEAAGGSIFAQLPLIFAIGVGIGWSKDSAGAAALAGAVAYLIMTAAMKAIEPTLDMGVLAGIIAGLIGGICYNRFHQINLPSFLSFFGGKRFVPIISGLIALVLAGIFGEIWPPVQLVIKQAGEWIVAQGATGAGIFATVNRLLIPTGLHLLINTIAWFEIGTYIDPITQIVSHGDLHRFYAGDKTAGMFMAGFYPVMMFGLPAAALAMYHAAPKNRRAQAGGILFSTAFTAFLTGVTEPLEFLFMFLAPVLYLIHAVLTGLSAFIATMLNVHAGFTFSAGAIDFLLMMNLPAANRVYYLLMMGLIWAFLYYVIFAVAIRVFDLKTPGREDELSEDAQPLVENTDMLTLAQRYCTALGGISNFKVIDACITRLRVVLHDMSLIDDATCKKIGASGLVRLPNNNLQVIIGPKVEMIADHLRHMAKNPDAVAKLTEVTSASQAQLSKTTDVEIEKENVNMSNFIVVSPMTGHAIPLEDVPDPVFAEKIVGDGLAIIPEDKNVTAPCDGVVTKLFHTNHAFIVESSEGVQVMVHVGVDTVQLNGQGFTAHVKEGEKVTKGQLILELDLAFLREKAKSIASPVIILNTDEVGVVSAQVEGAVSQGQTAYRVG